MRLTKRLALLSKYVPAQATVADIGTDHAYLPIFLIESGLSPKVIATDLKAGPLASARQAVAEHRLQEQIVLRLGYGLQPLVPAEVEVLILAGLGGNTIREILACKAEEVLAGVRRLIMQPMADAEALRFWLVKNGWKIFDEQLINENKRLYQIIVAEPGLELTSDPFYLELGPRLIEKKDPLLPLYLENIRKQYKQVLEGVSAGKSQAARQKAMLIQHKITRLEEVVKCL